MKTTFLNIGSTALAAAFFLTSCQNADQSSSDSAKKQTEVQQDETAQTTPTTKRAELNALYPHYLHLQEALVEGDVAQAKEAALLIEEASKLWDGGKGIQTAAGNILSATDLQKQREAFATLSDALVAQIKAEGVASGEFYLAHCPMAANNDGANWISPSKNIRNPYFGEKMMTCGSITETIKKL
ncbi:DUF3347 domain-containing protein [Olivibacter ginsenosidimutans]|uniref:DUF3347 domain-containing protein n=1 Tax=Olivibacter ginsenosidimutans TaxID=1176537 RepID=A0ABP9CD18_9SPHI